MGSNILIVWFLAKDAGRRVKNIFLDIKKICYVPVLQCNSFNPKLYFESI